MKAKKIKTGKKRTRPFRPGMFIIFLVLCCVVFGPQAVTLWKIEREIRAMEAYKADLLVENRCLQKQVGLLNSSQMIEKIAREELGMIKPGEKLMVQVVPGTASGP